MSDRPRRKARATPRASGPSLDPLPRRIENPWEPLRALSDEAVERVLDAAHRILEEGGVEVRSPRARDILRRAGALVADEMVRLPRDLVEHLVGLAPS